MSSLLTKSAVLLLLTSSVVAQSDPLGSIVSAAVSVYTEVTSILASDASNAASTTSSSASTTSSSSTTTSSSASTLATSTSATPTNTRSSTSAAAAAVTNPASGHHSGGISGTTLAIILGCVLGALALGLLALVLLICCKRRRRNSRNSTPRVLSPDGDEIESWRGHKNRPQSRDGLIGGYDHEKYRNEHGGMPNMSQHPAFSNDRNHQNPFVPEPPAPRRSAPNSRAGLTDGSVPGQEPYLTNSDRNHHHGGQLAAGAGGAAIGAAALHHHDKNKHHSDTSYNGNTHDEKPGFMRRSLPGNAYPTPTTNDDAYALNKIPSRRSGDGGRPYNGDDYGYGTGPYEAGARGIRQPNTSAPLSPFNSSGHHRGPSGGNHNHDLMAAGAGALGGAALASHHHNQRDRSNSAPRRSYDSAKTPGPQALLSHHPNHPLPHSERDLVSPISSDSYSSAHGIPTNHRPTLSGTTAATNTHHIPSEMPGDVPTPTPSSATRSLSRDRPVSGAPAAAALAHRSVPLPDRSARRSGGGIPDAAVRDSEPSSEDSTWRLSSGMPGGWGRNSQSANRRDSSPSTNDAHLRNAGINPVGRGESPVRAGAWQPMQGTGRRLRLADLKREEEERDRRERGDWEGEGQGVGRAM